MRIFNFLSWYWNTYLTYDSERIALTFLIWGVFFVLSMILSFIFAEGAILGIFILGTLVSLLLWGIYNLVIYVRDRYLEWKERTGQ